MIITVKSVVEFVLILWVGGLGLAGSVTGLQMVDEVNAKLPTKEQFNGLGWYPAKTQRLHREYRRLFPSGRLLWRQGILAVAALLCVLVIVGLMEGVVPVVFLGGAGGLILWFTFSSTDF